MTRLDSMETLLVDELRDLLDAEKQLVRALPKMAKAASSPELKAAFEEHLLVTEKHVSRLEEAFEALSVSPRGKKCVGMQGLIAQGEEHIENGEDEDVLDAALIADAQKVEHYEISAYGSAREHATGVGRSEIAELLQQSLDQEKEADLKLTTLAEDLINQQAATQDEEPEASESDEESDEEFAKPWSRTTSGRRSR